MIFLDGAVVLLGIFILVWETVVGDPPNPLTIGAGIGFLGAPTARRLTRVEER
jgi:hypothetical protein